MPGDRVRAGEDCEGTPTTNDHSTGWRRRTRQSESGSEASRHLGELSFASLAWLLLIADDASIRGKPRGKEMVYRSIP